MATQVINFPKIANAEAQSGWHVVSVVPLRYVLHGQNWDLESITIIMERDKP